MTRPDDGPGPDPAAPGFRRGLALLVAGTYFMENLDATVIAPAAPAVAAELGVAPVDVTSAVTAYVLTLGVLIPVSGWLADRFGARRVFLVAVAVFTLASAGCAVAPDLTVLTLTRVAQGAGGALMVPVGRLTVLRTSPKADLVRAIAYLTWPALLAPVVAPVLGGLLADHASWRWIFVINVPLGVVAIVVAVAVVPRLREPAPGRLDRVGFVLTAVGMAALIAATDGLRGGIGPGTAVAGIVAAVGLVAAVRHLRRTAAPLVDLALLSTGTYRVAVLGGSVYRAGIVAVPFLLPLYFEVGLGWSATRAGLVIVALFVGNVAVKPVTTPLMRRYGIRAVLLGSATVGAACVLALAVVPAGAPLPALLALLAVSGIVRSTGFTAYNSIAFADVEPLRMSHATTLHATLQQIGAGLGVAAGAGLVRLGAALDLTPGPAGPYRLAFALLAAVLVLPVAEAALALPRTAGDAVVGRAAPAEPTAAAPRGPDGRDTAGQNG